MIVDPIGVSMERLGKIIATAFVWAGCAAVAVAFLWAATYSELSPAVQENLSLVVDGALLLVGSLMFLIGHTLRDVVSDLRPFRPRLRLNRGRRGRDLP